MYLQTLHNLRKHEWKINIFPYGDSTTLGQAYDYDPNINYPVNQRYGYPWKLRELITEFSGYPCDEFPQRVGRGATNIGTFRSTVDADLALRLGRADIILINIGKNDRSGPITSQHVSNYLYIVDSMIAKYPGVKIYLARPWMPSHPMSVWDELAHVCDLVQQQRHPQVQLGIDERQFLPNGDYIISNHPNHAGYMLTAEKWLEVLTT